MNEKDILVLGSKEYPLGISAKYETYLGGGVEKYVDVLTKLLVKKGYRVHLMVKLFPNQKKFEKINKSLYIYRTKYKNGKFWSLTSIAYYNFLEGIKIFRKQKLDCIFCNGLWPGIAGLSLRTFLKKPVIIRTAGMNFVQWSGLSKKILFFLEKRIYKKADKLVFLSKEDKKNFEKLLNLSFSNYSIIPTGVEKQPIKKPRKKLNKKINLIFIGRLKKIKGINHLIEGISLLNLEIKNKINCSIIGEGPDKEELKKLARDLKLDKQVKFLGYRLNIDSLNRKQDIFILPSLSEGLPLTALEAMSHGLPCIISKLNLPFPKNSVFYIKPGSKQEIKRAIETIVLDYGLRKTLSKKSHGFVRKNHDWNSVANSYEKIFEELENA